MSAEISQSRFVKGTHTPAAQIRAQACWMELAGVSMQREDLLSSRAFLSSPAAHPETWCATASTKQEVKPIEEKARRQAVTKQSARLALDSEVQNSTS